MDLNADVGEGPPDVEAPLIALLSSVNVACGLHAGGPTTRRRTELAIEHGAAVGAFGRINPAPLPLASAQRLARCPPPLHLPTFFGRRWLMPTAYECDIALR